MVQNKNQQKPPMFAKDQIIEVFFKLDEFWKIFSRFSPKCIEQTDRKKRHYHRDGKMSVSEIMLIMILFHSSNYLIALPATSYFTPLTSIISLSCSMYFLACCLSVT